ncbi:MAG TPA: hypothetical protein VGN15_07680 [Ktedonobacteraceae bacterium]|jgi:hypothetical protein|nr:hypothetical protein [Ktedonobacteraceae bacterium]
MHKLLVLPFTAALLLAGCGGPSPQQQLDADISASPFADLTTHATLDTKVKPPTVQVKFISTNPNSDVDGVEMGQIIAQIYEDKTLGAGDGTFTYTVSKDGLPLDIMTFVVHAKAIQSYIHNGQLDRLDFSKSTPALEVTNFSLVNSMAAGIGSK